MKIEVARSQGGASDWLSDIGKACDELGYAIRMIEPGRIELTNQHMATVVIETPLLSGDLLRRYLWPQNDK